MSAQTKTKTKHEAFEVYIPRGDSFKWIDTVFATGYSVEEMLRSLIDHDGYPVNIVVKKRK